MKVDLNGVYNDNHYNDLSLTRFVGLWLVWHHVKDMGLKVKEVDIVPKNDSTMPHSGVYIKQFRNTF